VTVLFSPEAEADLLAALDYIRERNSGAVLKLAERVFSTLEQLASEPIDGPEHTLTTGELVRGWPIRPFRIYYQRRSDAIYVLRVYHHARRPIVK